MYHNGIMLSNRIVFLIMSFLCVAKCIQPNRTKELKCLWWSKERKSFLHAQKDCEDKGGHLATFKTRERMNILKKKTQSTWIGLDDRENQGVYRNHDDNSIMDVKGCYGEMYFNQGEPKSNSWREPERCIHLFGAYKVLASDPCWSRKLYVCDVPCST